MKIVLKMIMIIEILFLSISCCHEPSIHCGENRINGKYLIKWDSLVINADNLSGAGNFFMQDSSLFFADLYYMAVYEYNVFNGEYITKHLGYGHGPNELPSCLYVYPSDNQIGEWIIVDNSLLMYSYNRESRVLKRLGFLDFNWDENDKSFDTPALYNIMEMTDFGIDFTYINDSTLLLPINIMERSITNSKSKMFDKGHILGELDLKTMHIKNVVGKFPMIYNEKPNSYFDFFHYILKNDTLFVNHSIDSLIYVYEYPDKLLYTMGYEYSDINRDYTCGYDIDMSDFKKDCKTVGYNTGLINIPQTNLFIRTAVNNSIENHTVLQVYEGADLVYETKVPFVFKIIGYLNGKVYGVNMLPIEDEIGNMNFTLYNFRIKNNI